MQTPVSRRAALAAGSLAVASCCGVLPRQAHAAAPKAQVAITFDLEMSRNFPVWEDTHWDYEKGNLNDETKRYTLEAARRIKAAGGVMHAFSVARVLEQENVDWLKQLAADGHLIGNHTYDHVNVTATDPAEIQFRFKRSPWLVEGKKPAEIIRENIRMANVALKQRLGIEVAGFRTPGGFVTGLDGRDDLHAMLKELGFSWVSSKYPSHPIGMEQPTEAVYAAIVDAQKLAQPYRYPNGLVEVPMNPISDIGAFRGGRWKLAWFLEAIRRGLAWAIENRAAYDFLAHPSCLYVTDPKFEAVDLICQMVKDAGDKAELVDLNQLARRA